MKSVFNHGDIPIKQHINHYNHGHTGQVLTAPAINLKSVCPKPETPSPAELC